MNCSIGSSIYLLVIVVGLISGAVAAVRPSPEGLRPYPGGSTRCGFNEQWYRRRPAECEQACDQVGRPCPTANPNRQPSAGCDCKPGFYRLRATGLCASRADCLSITLFDCNDETKDNLYLIVQIFQNRDVHSRTKSGNRAVKRPSVRRCAVARRSRAPSKRSPVPRAVSV